MSNSQDERINEINSLFEEDFKKGRKILETQNNPDNNTPDNTDVNYVLKGIWKFISYNSILLFFISIINFVVINIIFLGGLNFKTTVTTVLITILLYFNFYIFKKMGIKILIKK